MSKAKLILELYAQLVGTMPENKLPMAVAERIGTTDSYVRTVARQRKGRSRCEAEQRYLQSSLGRESARRQKRAKYLRIKANPEKYEKMKARWRLGWARRQERKRAEANQLA